jgi:hypothetical protein
MRKPAWRAVAQHTSFQAFLQKSSSLKLGFGGTVSLSFDSLRSRVGFRGHFWPPETAKIDGKARCLDVMDGCYRRFGASKRKLRSERRKISVALRNTVVHFESCIQFFCFEPERQGFLRFSILAFEQCKPPNRICQIEQTGSLVISIYFQRFEIARFCENQFSLLPENISEMANSVRQSQVVIQRAADDDSFLVVFAGIRSILQVSFNLSQAGESLCQTALISRRPAQNNGFSKEPFRIVEPASSSCFVSQFNQKNEIRFIHNGTIIIEALKSRNPVPADFRRLRAGVASGPRILIV